MWVVTLVVPGEREYDHAVIFREQYVHTPIVREMPAAQREVPALYGRESVPGGLAALALQARDRRVVRPPVSLVQRSGNTSDRVNHENGMRHL